MPSGAQSPDLKNDCEIRRVRRERALFKFYVISVFTGITFRHTVFLIGQEETNDDGERHINGHTAVSELPRQSSASRICRVRAKNHLGSRAWPVGSAGEFTNNKIGELDWCPFCFQ